MVEGYNVAIKLDSKTFVGRTQEDLNISANVKESITKDDAGVKQKRVTGHDVTLKVAGLLDVTNTTATIMDRDAAIELALKTGDDAEFTVLYTCSGGDSYTGTGVITGYSESTSADPDTDSTVSLDIQIVGGFTKTTS